MRTAGSGWLCLPASRGRAHPAARLPFGSPTRLRFVPSASDGLCDETGWPELRELLSGPPGSLGPPMATLYGNRFLVHRTQAPRSAFLEGPLTQAEPISSSFLGIRNSRRRDSTAVSEGL